MWLWLVLLAGVGGSSIQETALRPSPRTTEVLRLDCASTIGRREVTLFGNGTIRVREGPRGEEIMYLGELVPDEVAAYVRRLEEEDLSESQQSYGSVEGDWVEECVLEIELPEREPRRFEFHRYDSLSLELNRILAIALELDRRVERRAAGEGLPRGYKPRVGDRLRRVDDEIFEVMGFTGDGLGVELSGVDQPLVLYIPKDLLSRRFVALESRRPPW